MQQNLKTKHRAVNQLGVQACKGTANYTGYEPVCLLLAFFYNS